MVEGPVAERAGHIDFFPRADGSELRLSALVLDAKFLISTESKTLKQVLCPAQDDAFVLPPVAVNRALKHEGADLRTRLASGVSPRRGKAFLSLPGEARRIAPAVLAPDPLPLGSQSGQGIPMLAFKRGIASARLSKGKTVWPNAGVLWNGVFVGNSTPASQNKPDSSDLLDLIERRRPDEQYFLSANAAEGILRRVDAQGRHLFPPLRRALERLSGRTPQPTKSTKATLPLQLELSESACALP